MKEDPPSVIKAIEEAFQFYATKGDSKIAASQLQPTEGLIERMTQQWKDQPDARVSMEEFAPIYKNVKKEAGKPHTAEEFQVVIRKRHPSRPCLTKTNSYGYFPVLFTCLRLAIVARSFFIAIQSVARPQWIYVLQRNAVGNLSHLLLLTLYIAPMDLKKSQKGAETAIEWIENCLTLPREESIYKSKMRVTHY